MIWLGRNASESTLNRTSESFSDHVADAVGDEAAPSPDLLALAQRVHDDHPDVPLDELAAMATQEHEELGRARVQNFRAILTERAVRRRVLSQHGATQD